MSTARLLLIKLLLPVLLLYCSGGTYALAQSPETSGGIQDIDTSEYLPLLYPGALEYNLMIAASNGYPTEIERLIKMGADVNTETNEGASPLVFAVSNNRAEAVKTLLKQKVVVDKITQSYETPLLIAVKNANFEIAEALIRSGANVDYQDRYGASPLHYASIYGYIDIVDLLLYYDAAISPVSTEGTTPLLATVWAGYADVADLLIQRGANTEARDFDGFTPFLMAAYTGDTLIMSMLIKKGADIYAETNTKHNALTLTILTGDKDATELLLKAGNGWTDPARDAVSPYKVAEKYGRKDIVNILKINNVPGKINHEIDQMAITVGSRFGLNDYYTGLSFSCKEPYLNGGIIAGIDMKLWYTRVMIQNSEHLFYQYKDKGAMVYAGLFKDFPLTDNQGTANFYFSTSLLTGYSFGNKLKGTLIAPENKFNVIPDVSLKWTKKFLTLSLGMEYLKSDYYKVGPIWLRFGCSFNLYFDRIRTQVKTIKWN